MKRRRFLATAALGSLAGCSGGETDPSEDQPPGGASSTATVTDTETTPDSGSGLEAVGLETLASGLQNPLDAAFHSDLVYVAEQPGTVRVLDDDGVRGEPLLDLRDTVVTGFEQGLLGIALHPDFADNRRLFVRYSAPPRSGTPSGYSHTFVLAEFTVSDDGLRASPDTERTVLEIPEPQANHNAGSIRFGPEGYLYVGVGDGGAAGDQGTGHVEDWYSAVPGGNGQDVTENLLGGILRIDVDDRAGQHGYAVPENNPLVGTEGRDEYYAWGLRNPWRLAVDGSDLYAGDVGQNGYEEVDLIEKGGNYGWNVKEGTHCFDAEDCPDSTPGTVRGGEPLLDPVIEYPHSGAAVSGISVIPGNVYRGSDLPALAGQFVFGDYRAGGELFTATPTDEGLWRTGVLPLADADAGELSALLAFRRHDGELYVLGNDAGGSGGFHRLAPAR